MKTVRCRLTSARGFTIVELMVAITIGLIVTAAVSTLFVSTKRNYLEQDRQAKMQENARFALNFLTYDLRLSGYYGCLDEVNSETVNNAVSAGLFLNVLYPVEGLNNATGTWYPSANTTLPTSIVANTDAIVLRMASPSSSVQVVSPMPNTSAQIKVDSVAGLSVGDIVMLSDCASADVFQITSVQTSSLHLGHNSGSGTPGNSTQQLSKRYSPPAKVLKFTTRTYFIRNNSSGIPSLFRQDNAGAAEELITGVDQMQLTYGKDTDVPPDKIPNIYLAAGQAGLQTPAEWSRVRTVRIGLLVRTPSESGGDKDAHAGTWNLNGYTAAAYTDNNRRRMFHVTVNMRNL